MKIQNQTTQAIVLSDVLVDSLSQYQSGLKNLSLAPLGSTFNGVPTDSAVVPNALAGQSVALQQKLQDGSILIVGSDEQLGGSQVPGVQAGLGVGRVFDGVVKATRLETGTPTYRIMFGAPGVGDPVVDQEIDGYPVTLTTDVVVTTASAIVGTVTPTVSAAPSGKIMVTFVGSSAGDQAGFGVYARIG